MLLPSLYAWVGVGASRGVLGHSYGVRVTWMLIGVKDQLEFFTRPRLNGIFHEWLLFGGSNTLHIIALSPTLFMT
jgi:hypothetical protein